MRLLVGIIYDPRKDADMDKVLRKIITDLRPFRIGAVNRIAASLPRTLEAAIMAKERWVKKNVKTKDLKGGPMRHEKLPPELETKLRVLWQSLGTLMGSRTFEQVETSFCRDKHPEREIAVWEGIEKALREWETKRGQFSRTQRERKFRQLLTESMQSNPIKAAKREDE